MQPPQDSKGTSPAPAPAPASRPAPNGAARVSNALRLDGKSGCIVIPPTRNEDLDMAGSSLTLAIWIKPSQSYDDEELLMEHGVWQQSKGMYQLSTADSRTLRFNFPAMNSNEGRLDAAVNLADGNWHFAVATFDTSTHLAKIYDNGVLLKSKTVRESIAGDDTPTQTFIGCRGNGTDHFRGEVGQLLIYKRAISAEQVARLHGQVGGDIDSRDQEGLVAGYRLNEGQGTTVADFSGHGNTGTLKGGATWDQYLGTWEVETAALELALELDGKSTYVNLGHALDFSKDSAFSVSFWMKSTGGNRQMTKEAERAERLAWSDHADFNLDQQMIVGKSAGFLDHSTRAGPCSRPTADFCTSNSTPRASFAAASCRHGNSTPGFATGNGTTSWWPTTATRIPAEWLSISTAQPRP